MADPAPSPGVMSRMSGLDPGRTPLPPHDEYYTPIGILDAARASMGGIDLDPASCATAQTVVRAGAWYSDADDGLDPALPWAGRVWLNPPFTGGLLRRFARRLVREWLDGSLSAACLLAPHVAGSTWPQEVTAVSTGLVLLRRVPWWGPRTQYGSALAHVVWLLGDCALPPWHRCEHVSGVYTRLPPPPDPQQSLPI